MPFADLTTAVLAVTAGRVDAVLADKPQVEWAAAESKGRLCVTGTFRTTRSLAGIAVPKQAPGFADALQKAVEKIIKRGEYSQIARKWGVVQGAVRTSKVVTKPEQVEENADIFPDRYAENWS
jgi:polar amino acid transport system substrate-binding protein